MNPTECVVKTNVDLESRRYEVARIERVKIYFPLMGLGWIECSKRQTSTRIRKQPTRLRAGLLKGLWKSEEGRARLMV